MTRLLLLVSIFTLVLLFVGCGTETASDKPAEDSGNLDCGWIMPTGWAHMTRDEYESWLRKDMPHTITGCELPEHQIQRALAGFYEDQVRQRRWERHFEKIDVMVNIRAEYRQLAADEFISPAELLYMCNAMVDWRVALDSIVAFLDECREVEPEFVEKDPSIRTLESETQKLLIWVADIEIRCNVN